MPIPEGRRAAVNDFRGLHNPERHSPVMLWVSSFGTGWATDRVMCDNCRTECVSGVECRCCLAAEVESLRQKRDAAEAKVQRVRELHPRDADMQMCQVCMWEWPCPTISALDGDQ